MILIAHRGNTRGKNVELENHPLQVETCASLGYDIEIDVRIMDGRIFLGHDAPGHEVSLGWMDSMKYRLWLHCKNHNALRYFIGSDFNYFWHDTDDYTITSKGFVWAYPGKPIVNNCVAVLPESWTDETSLKCEGICSDFLDRYTK